MDEITRNHPHNNIIMMHEAGGGSLAPAQQNNGVANGNSINNGSILNSNTKNRDHYQ